MTNNFISQETIESEDEILNKILENVTVAETYSEVKLPSLGQIYGLASDTIHVRGLNFEDEKLLASLKDKRKSANVLLERCIKEDIDPAILIPQDKIYILIHIRYMSVGAQHEFNMTCPNCSVKSEVSIDVLNTFECRYPDEPLKSTVEIMLPKLQKPVVVRRGKSSEIENNEANFLDNLWRFVVSIDGHSSATIRSKVINMLPREDIKEIIKLVTSDGIGLDTRFMFSCNACNHEELTEYKFQSGFFTMT